MEVVTAQGLLEQLLRSFARQSAGGGQGLDTLSLLQVLFLWGGVQHGLTLESFLEKEVGGFGERKVPLVVFATPTDAFDLAHGVLQVSIQVRGHAHGFCSAHMQGLKGEGIHRLSVLSEGTKSGRLPLDHGSFRSAVERSWGCTQFNHRREITALHIRFVHLQRLMIMLMKKLILALVVTLSCQWAQSQIYLEWSEVEILSERKATEVVWKDSLSNGTPFLIFTYVDTTHFTRRYFFERTTQRCNLYVVEPANQKALETFIQFCGENYTPAGERRWKTALNGFTVDIILEQGAVSGNHYFYFERQK